MIRCAATTRWSAAGLEGAIQPELWLTVMAMTAIALATKSRAQARGPRIQPAKIRITEWVIRIGERRPSPKKAVAVTRVQPPAIIRRIADIVPLP
jgi:hypothetical protein